MEADSIELVCQEVVELLTEYLTGTLSPRDRTRFDEHLAGCPPCTSYLAQVRTMLALAGELSSARASSPPAEDVAHQLGDLFRRWHAKRES